MSAARPEDVLASPAFPARPDGPGLPLLSRGGIQQRGQDGGALPRGDLSVGPEPSAPAS
ncbi:hypothetical protein [Streptomyces sp. NPDC014734]|uniref:hypothetical protein n=1 Tax=Streptomyces sp. NPDC014734 TaxID=3364886 RepID=UPI0036F7D472